MNICFLGFGRRGKTLYGYLAQMPEVHIVGIFDPLPSGVFPTPHYSDARKMLTECKPDLVIDASPPSNRFKNILLCNRFKTPLICEKPLLFSASEIKKLRSVTINIYPAYQLAYDPLLQKAFSLAGNSLSRVALHQKVNLPNPGWRSKNIHVPGGVLSDNGAHLIHLAVRHFGLPGKVVAIPINREAGIESAISCILWYKNFTVEVSASWHSPAGKETKIFFSTKTKDIEFIETNQKKQLSTVSAKVVGNWTRRQEDFWYQSRGIDRNLRSNPFNTSHGDAIATMLAIFLKDIERLKGRSSKLARKEFDVSLMAAKTIAALHSSMKAGRLMYL